MRITMDWETEKSYEPLIKNNGMWNEFLGVAMRRADAEEIQINYKQIKLVYDLLNEIAQPTQVKEWDFESLKKVQEAQKNLRQPRHI